MTGRKGRVVSNDDGSITYESRSELDVPVEILNLTEKQRFMDGEKVNAEFSQKWEESEVWSFNSGIRTVGSRPSVTLLVSWLGSGLISTQVFCLSFTPQSVQCKKMNLSWLGRNADTREKLKNVLQKSSHLSNRRNIRTKTGPII